MYEYDLWLDRQLYEHDRRNAAAEADPIDYGLMRNSLVHLSQEAAQAHADTLNAICRGDID